MTMMTMIAVGMTTYDAEGIGWSPSRSFMYVRSGIVLEADFQDASHETEQPGFLEGLLDEDIALPMLTNSLNDLCELGWIYHGTVSVYNLCCRLYYCDSL